MPRPRAEKRTPQAPEGLAPEGDGEGGASVVIGFGPTLSLPMNYLKAIASPLRKGHGPEKGTP